MGYILLIVFLILSFLGVVCLYKSVVIYFKILAILTNTEYKGIISSSQNLNPTDWFKGNYINIFPISLFLYKIDSRVFDEECKEVKALYQLKFKYEKKLWSLFALGLLTIPIVEYLIRPMLLK